MTARSAASAPTPDADDDASEGLRARKRRTLRTRIVALAGERFDAVGYDATNMREIADAAGVAYQTLYNHFPCKVRLAMAWLEARSNEVTATVEALWGPPPDDPVAALKAGADAYLDIVTSTDRQLQRDVVAEYVRMPEAFSNMTAALKVGGLGGIRTLLEQWRAAGRLLPDADVETLGGALFALVDHAMLRYVGMEGEEEAQVRSDTHRQIEVLIRPYVPR